MNKSVFSYLFLFVLLWLVGCGPAPVTPAATVEIAAASPIPTYTPTLSPSATPTSRPSASTDTAEETLIFRLTPVSSPTPTPRATATIIPTSTATRSNETSTPIPPPVWAEGITPLLTLDHGEAFWSPTSNEVLLAVCPPYRPNETDLPPNGTIYYAAAPEFTPLTPVFTDFYCPGMWSISAGVDITWSLDGQKVVFVGIDAKKYYGWWHLDSGPATIWLREGQRATVNTVVSEIQTIRIPSFGDWVNEETLLLSAYASGGTSSGLFLNIRTGEVSSDFYVHGYSFRPSPHYIGTGEGVDFSMTAMVVSIDLLWTSTEPAVTWDKFLRLSRPQINQLPIPNSTFLDWLPGTDTMLVRTWLITDPALCRQGQPCVEDNQLQWWDVAADQLQPFLPFGLNATLSPNGDTVAVTTTGPIEISSDGQPLQELPAPENTDSSHNYLLLVDRLSGRALLPSLPTAFSAQFSPDGQYLAFYTAQQLLLDGEGRPTGDTVPGSTKQLNILDLTSRQLLTTIPATSANHPQSFIWSPSSQKILMRDTSENLMVYDLQTRKLIPITVNGKNQISRASWSFDGQYLSFELYVDFETEKVVIIRAPE